MVAHKTMHVPAMIEDFKSHRASQKGKRTKRAITSATINRELACLKCMFFPATISAKDPENPANF
jgi:hypothetical protein